MQYLEEEHSGEENSPQVALRLGCSWYALGTGRRAMAGLEQ